MRRTLFQDEHESFRKSVKTFLEREAVPYREAWEAAGQPDRHFFHKAGELGILGLQVPESYGGSGQISFKFNAIVTEEVQAAGLALGGLRLITDIAMPYFLEIASAEQRAEWLPGLVDGTVIPAIAMSEPEAGSDLRSIATRARLDGHEYVLNGAKTFISNGSIADVVITVVRTGDGRDDAHSLILVPTDAPGFNVSRRLEKIGLKAQDLAEFAFTDVRVPVGNLLGDPGRAFEYLTANLAQERLSIALNSQAAAEAALRMTVGYVADRKAFGKPISSFQNTRFELAACSAEIEAGRALADAALEAHDNGEFTASDAARLKLFCTEMHGRVVDRCLQLFGGYGYMLEYPIARAYADARVARIYGGSNEIMKVIIAKSLGL